MRKPFLHVYHEVQVTAPQASPPLSASSRSHMPLGVQACHAVISLCSSDGLPSTGSSCGNGRAAGGHVRRPRLTRSEAASERRDGDRADSESLHVRDEGGESGLDVGEPGQAK